MALDVDRILQHLGDYGKFQMLHFVYIGLICMRGVWHLFGISFIASVPVHHCKVPEGAKYLRSVGSTGKLEIDQCHQYSNFSLSNATEKCKDGWSYLSRGSIIDEWNLVCDRAYLADISTSVFMAGVMFGGLVLSPLGDYLGRKWIIITGLLLQSVIGSLAAFVKNFVVFTVLRFFLGALNQVVALVAYVALTETFSPSHRTRPGIALQFFWAAGICLLALLAWLMPMWRHLQLAISVPNILSLCLIWLFQESIPWYVMKGKVRQAEKGLCKIAKTNKKFLPANCLTDSNLNLCDLEKPCDTTADDKKSCTVEDEENESEEPCSDNVAEESSSLNKNINAGKRTRLQKNIYTTVDLFRYPRMRIYTIVMFFIWFINSLDYYGISLSIPSLHGNVYINVFISGLVEVPAYLVVMFALDKFGRKRPLALFALVSGVANLATAFTPERSNSGVDLRVLITIMGMIGKFAITGSFCTVFLFAAEIFPTVLRNAGVGFVSLGDSVGGIVAPLILLTSQERPELPRAIFGVLACVSALAVLILPETVNRPLLETVEAIESHEKEGILQNARSFVKGSCVGNSHC